MQRSLINLCLYNYKIIYIFFSDKGSTRNILMKRVIYVQNILDVICISEQYERYEIPSENKSNIVESNIFLVKRRIYY
jgi:hypothetical protein